MAKRDEIVKKDDLTNVLAQFAGCSTVAVQTPATPILNEGVRLDRGGNIAACV